MLKLGVIFIALFTLSGASKVPALIWSESRPMSDIPQSSMGNTVPTKEFTQDYLLPLTSGKGDGNLIVFLQDKLSLQDFTDHADVYSHNGDGGVFKNIKRFMDDLFSVHLSAVSSPGKALEDFRKLFQGKVHEVEKPSELEDIDLSNGQNLIIVTLTPVTGASHEGEVFQKNDDHIGQFIHSLNKKNVKYSALYTAKSSVKIDNKAPSLKRHLLEDTSTTADNGTFVNISSCMFLYVKSLKVVMDKNGNNHSMLLNDSSNFKSDGSSCGNHTAILNLEYTGSDVKFTMQLTISDNNITQWNIKEALVKIDGSANNTDYTGEAYMDTSMIWAPKDYSYHCSMLGPVTTTSSNISTVNVSLTFEKFQLQPFNIYKDRFSDGWDCIVFFTEGIWMGIFSVVIMILILLYGLSMLSNIKTMDKFDDAKGKTITVNVSE